MTIFLNDDKGKRIEISSQDLLALVEGTSIRGLKHDEKVFSLAVDEQFYLDVLPESKSGLEIVLYNWREARTPIQLLTEHKPKAIDVERRIRALRQIYALIVILRSDRGQKIPSKSSESDFDLENLLSDEERLHIVSVGTGSVWATIANWSKEGAAAVKSVTSLLVNEVREAHVRLMYAKARIAEAEARRKEGEVELELEQKRSEVALNKVRHLAEVYELILEKIPEGPQREAALKIFANSAKTLDIKIEPEQLADQTGKIGPPPT